MPESRLVRIRNTSTGSTIYCEALPIGESLLRRYNKDASVPMTEPGNVIVLSHWYRSRLNGYQYRELELEIRPARGSVHAFIACIQHPQIAVRLATKLAAWSVILGAVGLALGIIGLVK